MKIALIGLVIFWGLSSISLADGKVPLKLTSTSLEEVLKCLPQMKAVFLKKDSLTLELLRAELEKAYEIKSETLNYQWLELKRDNSPARMSLRINAVLDANGKPKKRMQLYAYDSEGVPQEVSLIREHEFNPNEKIIKLYTDSYEIVSNEKSMSYLAFPGNRLNLKFLGPKLKEIELIKLSEDKRLLCREADMVRPLCQCF